MWTGSADLPHQLNHQLALWYMTLRARWSNPTCPAVGTVTTLVSSEERPKLKAMASELGIELIEVEAPAIQPPAADSLADMDGAKKALEDVYNLY